MSTDLRKLRDRPFELLVGLDDQLRAARFEAAAGQVWTGLAFRIGTDGFVAPREDVREVLPPPELTRSELAHPDDWSSLPIPASAMQDEDPTESERRQQPELSRVKPLEKKQPIDNEFEIEPPDDIDEDATRNQRLTRLVQGVARQVSLDPNDGMEL